MLHAIRFRIVGLAVWSLRAQRHVVCHKSGWACTFLDVIAPLSRVRYVPVAAGVLVAGLLGVHAALQPPVPLTPSGVHLLTTSPTVRQDMGVLHGCRLETHDGIAVPDRLCTPGAVDPASTPAQLCAPGRALVGIPTESTARWTSELARSYASDVGQGQLEQLVPASLGGVNAVSNLWLRPPSAAAAKQAAEIKIRAAVCAGTIPLRTAQEAVAMDWSTAVTRLGLG